MTSVAMRPLRFTTPAPSGIFWPGSVMIVNRIPRAIACSIFFPTFSRIVSALPYPWATGAMYPRASYPERPIDSSVFVARSNSCSRSTPPASSFDKSCGATGPRYPRAVFIFSNRRAQCWISKRDASLYPTGAFLRGHGFGAPSRPRCDNLPVDLLECFHSRGRPESGRPHGRHDRLRTLRDLGPERWRTRDVDADRSQGCGSPREDYRSVRHVRSDPPRLSVRRPGDIRERKPHPGPRGRGRVRGSAQSCPRTVWRPRYSSAVPAAGTVRPPRKRRESRIGVFPKHLRPRKHESERICGRRDPDAVRGERDHPEFADFSSDGRPCGITLPRVRLPSGPVAGPQAARNLSAGVAVPR